jgi:hypothetical protein
LALFPSTKVPRHNIDRQKKFTKAEAEAAFQKAFPSVEEQNTYLDKMAAIYTFVPARSHVLKMMVVAKWFQDNFGSRSK